MEMQHIANSKMTLAAANNIYDKFEYFSFISSEAERKDAFAAHQICLNLGLVDIGDGAVLSTFY